jgi:HK97 family phage portal protein
VRVSRRQIEGRVSLENPAIPISSDSITAILGTGLSTDAGVQVSEFTALRLTTVWRCVTLIAGVIAGLPLRVFEPSPDGRVEVYSPLLADPCADMTRFELWELVMAFLLLWGNAYLLKIPRELDDTIVRLFPLHPAQVTPNRLLDAAGKATGPKRYSVVGYSGYLTDDDLLHIPGFGYDGIRGLSPIAFARQAIGGAIAAETFGAKFFGSGSQLGGILKTERGLKEETAQAYKTKWRERVAGIANAHEVLILDGGMDFQQIGVPPGDAQFIESRKFSVMEICRLYGVPPHLAMDLEKSTSWGTGIAEQSLGFIRYNLSATWLPRIEQRLSKMLLPPQQTAEFSAEGVLRGDTAARYAAYTAALGGRPWMCPDDIRGLENMPRLGGDNAIVGTPPGQSADAPVPVAIAGEDK